MPEIRYYTVEQTRQVKVWANNPADAALIADNTFQGHSKGHKAEHVEGEPTSEVRDLDLVVREDPYWWAEKTNRRFT